MLCVPMGDLSYTIKEHFTFTSEELRALIIGIIISAFMFSFDEWGAATFDVGIGLRNLFNAMLIATLAFLVHQCGNGPAQCHAPTVQAQESYTVLCQLMFAAEYNGMEPSPYLLW